MFYVVLKDNLALAFSVESCILGFKHFEMWHKRWAALRLLFLTRSHNKTKQQHAALRETGFSLVFPILSVKTLLWRASWRVTCAGWLSRSWQDQGSGFTPGLINDAGTGSSQMLPSEQTHDPLTVSVKRQSRPLPCPGIGWGWHVVRGRERAGESGRDLQRHSLFYL